ncbi:hypothetical protein WA158_008374 [Blastocystis sp. Blastoise]
MDIEKNGYDKNLLLILKEYLIMYEDMIKDQIRRFESMANIGYNLEEFVRNIAITYKGRFVEANEKNFVFDSLPHNIHMNNDTGINVSRNTYDDTSFDLIRFANNDLIFPLSKRIIDTIEGSFLYESCDQESRESDGTVYLDYRGNDIMAYYVIDYLNGKKVDITGLCYKDQLELLDLYEFCGLVIPLDLVACRERRDTKKKQYKNGDEVSLFINGNQNDNIKEYLIKNGLWNNYVMNYDNGFIDYNHIEDSLYMNKKYEYIEYITQYVNNRYINIEEDKINDINKELFEKEMIELFGKKGREEVRESMMGKPNVFINSTIIEKKRFETPLVNWLGKEKRWKLLFRASEYDYFVFFFHNYCDNKGETVTLIKHIGHNNHMNIFGGYTDQSWESRTSNCDKPASKEFLFTLSNEHGIPPTQYLHNGTGNGIYCSSSYGPTFGGGKDIVIVNNCHATNDNAYNNSNSFTTVNTPQKSSLFVNTNNSDTQNYFTVEDYEVWGRA